MLRQKTYKKTTPLCSNAIHVLLCLWKFGQKLGEVLCRVEESGEPKMIGKTRGFMGTSPLIKLITYIYVYIYIYMIIYKNILDDCIRM